MRPLTEDFSSMTSFRGRLFPEKSLFHASLIGNDDISLDCGALQQGNVTVCLLQISSDPRVLEKDFSVDGFNVVLDFN